MASLVAIGSIVLSGDTIGVLPTVSEQSNKVAFLQDVKASSGYVAGVVDDSSVVEGEFRNDVAEWLGDVRIIQGSTLAYRDSVLDRQAQNHARHIAETCSDDKYNDWSEFLGTEIDEGNIITYTEAVFTDTAMQTFARDFTHFQTDYSRLFAEYNAAGIGVAEVTDNADPECGKGFVVVIHAADTR